MNLTTHGPAARRGLMLGVAFCVLAAPSALMSASEPPVPFGGGQMAAGPEHLVLAQADATPAERPVSYSMEQAERGEGRYEQECEECHGSDLRGGLNGGAPLSGNAFEEKYAGDLPASLLFSYMSTAMPPNSPGRYSANIYADIMAYILKENGYQPGAPLPSDMDSLDYLMMEK